MQKNHIKIAFLGCGHIAHVHQKFLSKIGLSVGAVCDSSEVRAKDFADLYKINSIYSDFDDLLKKYKPNVVHILVPPHIHFYFSKKALENSCNVVVEKPICENIDKLNELLSIANEKGLHISVDHTRVYNPLVIEARDKILQGRFGRITEIRYEYDDPSIERSNDYMSPTIRYKKGTPVWFRKIKGGVMADLLPHPLSVLLSFNDKFEITDINGKARNGIIEDVSVRLCSDSTIADISMSVHVKPLRNRISIFCEHGTVIIDLRNMYCTYSPERELPNIISRVLDTFSTSLQTQFRFLKSIIEMVLGRAHPYSGLDVILKKFYDQLTVENHNKNIEYDKLKKIVKFQDQIIRWFEIEKGLLDNVQTNRIEDYKLNDGGNILVTGGGGFIGRHLTEELLKRNLKVKVLCRSLESAENCPEEVGICIGDLRDKEKLEKALVGIDTVYHCAAAMSGDWADFKTSTIDGTENLLLACLKAGVNTFVYLSSIGILNYNQLCNGDTVDEQSPIENHPDKRGFYTKAKLLAELKVLEFKRENPQIRFMVIRPGLVYGKESNNNLNNAGVLLGCWLLVFGVGNRTLGLTYVKNLAKAMVSITLSKNESFESIIHVIDTKQPNINEYIAEHNKISKMRIKAFYIPILIWKLAFTFIDLLFLAIKRKKSFYRYKLASNSKNLQFKNNVFGKGLLVEDFSDWKEAIKESLIKQ